MQNENYPRCCYLIGVVVDSYQWFWYSTTHTPQPLIHKPLAPEQINIHRFIFVIPDFRAGTVHKRVTIGKGFSFYVTAIENTCTYCYVLDCEIKNIDFFYIENYFYQCCGAEIILWYRSHYYLFWLGLHGYGAEILSLINILLKCRQFGGCPGSMKNYILPKLRNISCDH